MSKEMSIKFAGLMEDYLGIPAFICEKIQKKLENGEYEEVIKYVVERRKEYEKELKEGK